MLGFWIDSRFPDTGFYMVCEQVFILVIALITLVYILPTPIRIDRDLARNYQYIPS
jgi:hypothetical protein